MISAAVQAIETVDRCLGDVVALDTARDDAVWITELGTDAHAHAASLALPQVQDAVTKGRPLITGIAQRITTNPVAGL